jgi:uncharacterized repeat protein (TIGR01451 family)
MGVTSRPSFWLGLLTSLIVLSAGAKPAAAVVLLSVEMGAAPSPVSPGALLTYDIGVTNDGDQAAQGVSIESAVPTGTTFFSASDGGMLGAGNSVTWDIGNLGAFSSQNVTLLVEVEFPRPPEDFIINAVQVTATGATPASDGTLTDVQPLGVDMSVDTSPPNCLGSPFRSYKLRFFNGSTSPITDLELTGEIPPGTVFDSATFGAQGRCSVSTDPCFAESGCPGGETCQVFWDIGTVASEQSGFQTFTVRVEDTEPAGATFDSSAVLTNGVQLATDSAPTTTVVDLPCPALSKIDLGPLTVEPGGRIQYRITAVNFGRVTATNSMVSDQLPNGTTFGTADPGSCGGDGPAGTLGIDDVIRWDLGGLDPTERVTMCLELDVESESPVPAVLNTADFSDDEGDLVSASESTTVQAATALKLLKDAEPSPVGPEEQVTYEITFQNIANFMVTGVEITDDLTTDLTPGICASFNAAATAACLVNGGEDPFVNAVFEQTPEGDVVRWDIGSVLPDGVATVCFVVDIAPDTPENREVCDGQILRNVARVRDDRDESTTATGRTRMRFPGEDPLVLLRLFKTAPGQNKVEAGDELVYTLAVKNRTNPPADFLDVTVTDDLNQLSPAGAATFLSAEATDCGGTGPDGDLLGNIVTWTLATLAANDEQTVCLRVRTSPLLTNGDVIRNMATASDLSGNSTEDSFTTEVFAKRLRVRMVDLDDPVQRGSQVRYEISVEGFGNEPLGDNPRTPDKQEKVRIKTRVPSGTTLVCLTGSPVDCTPEPKPPELTGMTLTKDPTVKGRSAIWTLDNDLQPGVGQEKKMEMVVKVKEEGRRRSVRAKVRVREFTFRSKSKARALTVVEEE